jgi:hypothetical protein
MPTLGRILIAIGLLGATSVPAAEMTVCIGHTGIPNNPRYLGYLATTQTRLLCEINRQNYQPTLPDLYADGWRLIQVVGGEQMMAQSGQNLRSPLYYLERETKPQPPAEPAEKEPEKKKKPFSLF